MALNYSLLLPRGCDIPSVGPAMPNLDRSPVYQSRLQAGRSFVSRYDPFFSASALDLSSIEFEQCSVVKSWNGASPDGVLGRRDVRWRSFVDGFQREAYSDLSLAAIAILGQFHTASTAQIAAFAGVDVSEAHRALTRLYASGVVLRSSVSDVPHDETVHRLGHIWRIASGRGSGPFVESWANRLRDFEYMMVTTGRDISRGVSGTSGTFAFRHNLQATELALRLMEMNSSVAGVLGEQAGSISNVVDTSRHEMRGNVADLAVVTNSGRVILIELTSARNATASISEKAMAWTLAIALATDLDLYVVFANSNPKHDRWLFRNRVLAGILAAENRLVNPGASLRRAQERIFVSDTSTHWFPMSHTVTTAFTTMDVLNPASLAFYRLAPDGAQLSSAQPVISVRAALSTPDWITEPVKGI